MRRQKLINVIAWALILLSAVVFTPWIYAVFATNQLADELVVKYDTMPQRPMPVRFSFPAKWCDEDYSRGPFVLRCTVEETVLWENKVYVHKRDDLVVRAYIAGFEDSFDRGVAIASRELATNTYFQGWPMIPISPKQFEEFTR